MLLFGDVLKCCPDPQIKHVSFWRVGVLVKVDCTVILFEVGTIFCHNFLPVVAIGSFHVNIYPRGGMSPVAGPILTNVSRPLSKYPFFGQFLKVLQCSPNFWPMHMHHPVKLIQS